MTEPLPRDKGWTGIDVDGSGIDMYPAPASQLMSDIHTVLTNALNGWKKLDGKIEDLGGKLGDGPMGKPFKEKYAPAAKKLDEILTETLDSLQKLSKSGNKAVPIYVNQDQAAGQHFEF
jgi:hypothetical protein